MLKRFWKCEEGATAIEYGLIASLIAVAAIGGMTSLGSNNVIQMGGIRDKMPS